MANIEKTGRPTLEVDWEVFDELCRIQCTKTEIAAVLKMSDDTLSRRIKEEFGVTFTELYKEKRQAGFASIRRKQFEVAMAGNGNVGMLIWLGKNWLGQSDKIEETVKTELPSIEFVKARLVEKRDT